MNLDFYRATAQSYDADYAALGYDADIPFWVDLAVESGGPVLEMGCGTGRILLPTARAGIVVHGLDASPDMLEQLRVKLAAEPPEIRGRVSLTAGDACSTDLGRQFPLITAPFRVAQTFVDRRDQRAWLRNVRRHLSPGGSLCFDVFQPDYRRVGEPWGPNIELERVDPATGFRMRRIASTIPHPESQSVEVTFRWTTEDSDGNLIEERGAQTSMRWYTRAELENLLELEGFQITDYWGSFAREPYGPGARDQVIRARPVK